MQILLDSIQSSNFSILTGDINLSTSGNVTISPIGSVTLNPTAASTINNCSIGASTRGSGAFTSLAANGAVAFTSTTNSTTPTTGSVLLSGGMGVLGTLSLGNDTCLRLVGGSNSAWVIFGNLTSQGVLAGNAVRFASAGDGNALAFSVACNVTSVDYITASGVTGSPKLTAAGNSTNIDINLVPKGTGKVNITGSMCVGLANAAVIKSINSTSATLDFGNTTSGSYSDLNISVTGATTTSTVHLGIPAAAMPSAACSYHAWVSAADTVTIRFSNYSGADQNPASSGFRATVMNF